MVPPGVELEATQLVLSPGSNYFVVLESDSGQTFHVPLDELQAKLTCYKEITRKSPINARVDIRPIISMKEAGLLMGYRKRVARHKAKVLFKNSPCVVKIEGRMFVRTRLLMDLYGFIAEDGAMISGHKI